MFLLKVSSFNNLVSFSGEEELSWETRGSLHASGLLMENRETSQWMKNITSTRVRSGRTMERGRDTL